MFLLLVLLGLQNVCVFWLSIPYIVRVFFFVVVVFTFFFTASFVHRIFF